LGGEEGGGEDGGGEDKRNIRSYRVDRVKSINHKTYGLVLSNRNRTNGFNNGVQHQRHHAPIRPRRPFLCGKGALPV
jgi:hypothetical protein